MRAQMVSLTKPMLTLAPNTTRIDSSKDQTMLPNLESRLSSLSLVPASVRSLVLKKLVRSAMSLTSTLPAGPTGSLSPSRISRHSQAPVPKVSTIRTIHFSIIRLRHWPGLICQSLRVCSTLLTSTPMIQLSVQYSPITARLAARLSLISMSNTGIYGKVSTLYS